jgi:tetrapyrrole methylase family protein/MazG family protein
MGRFETLVSLLARLRGPGGCPWDREQTHRTLREALLEECYEVLEALDEGDKNKLAEELGDLLMQVVFHAQMAAEAGDFTIDDVIRNITTKLVNRHPHVFGSARLENAREVLASWDSLKRKEKKRKSLLDSVPKTLPALSYGQEVQGRAARVGFDWKDLEGVLDKVVEEADELTEAEGHDKKEREMGDLLFTLVNLARRLEIDAESALREANRRFFRRFVRMEVLCRERGVTFGELSFEEQNSLWEEAKRAEA